jgi:hypothetical protein
MLVTTYKTTQHQNPEDHNQHVHAVRTSNLGSERLNLIFESILGRKQQANKTFVFNLSLL